MSALSALVALAILEMYAEGMKMAHDQLFSSPQICHDSSRRLQQLPGQHGKLGRSEAHTKRWLPIVRLHGGASLAISCTAWSTAASAVANACCGRHMCIAVAGGNHPKLVRQVGGGSCRRRGLCGCRRGSARSHAEGVLRSMQLLVQVPDLSVSLAAPCKDADSSDMASAQQSCERTFTHSQSCIGGSWEQSDIGVYISGL